MKCGTWMRAWLHGQHGRCEDTQPRAGPRPGAARNVTVVTFAQVKPYMDVSTAAALRGVKRLDELRWCLTELSSACENAKGPVRATGLLRPREVLPLRQSSLRCPSFLLPQWNATELLLRGAHSCPRGWTVLVNVLGRGSIAPHLPIFF